MKAAFALNATPQPFSKFDRKHYFYPDLPLGYQITQFDEPIILGGSVAIELDDGTAKTIGVTRAHLEADAGKSTHPAGGDYSLVDLNRAGTPLLEIVSEPDMHSPAEAKAYARELFLRMKYAGVSDANLYYGNMRFDVNVSVSKTDTLGTRTETKNINSFKAVEKVVEYEIKRQIDVLEAGGAIVQETRGWDDTNFVTFSQRTKEDAHDYRYFPDPDIPPVTLAQVDIDEVAAEMPAMPFVIRDALRSVGLDKAAVESLLDAVLPAQFLYALQVQRRDNDHIKRIGNWLGGEIQGRIAKGELEWSSIKLDVTNLEALSRLTAAGKLSSTAAKEVLVEMLVSGTDPLGIATAKNLIQESDEGAILAVVDQVLADNPQAADDVRGGEMKAIGFLVGQVMKASRGKANPGLAQQLIKKQLGI
jgi:aspartyl-tRNA(Asn)/glutamyl-tRNA(Gln) amidotransferase subunit B